MINSYAFGFACVAAAAAAGADYVVQSKVAGQGLGSYSVSSYTSSIPARFGLMMSDRAKASRQSELARVHLPEAPEGWERRDWMPESSEDAMSGMTLVQQMAFKKTMRTAKKDARKQVWEYVRGNDVVRLSAHFAPLPEDGEETPALAAFVAPFVSFETANVQGYDIVQGVPVYRMIDPATGAGAGGKGPQYLQAFIGDRVAIGVYAEGNEAAMRMLLEQVNFDALNAMLDTPIAGVGRDAKPLSEEDRLVTLEAALAAAQNGAPKIGSAAVQQAGADGGQVAGLDEHNVARFSVGQDLSGSKEDAKPGRLKLSGGTSCLTGASGKFCK